MSQIQTFISKYKPYYIRDFYENESSSGMCYVLETLLKLDDLNLLLIGNVNSGKTTLLYAILREYYGKDNIGETNVMFINNLKEQGINNFRNEMKSFCQSRCTIHGKKKIIVIDDIDMVNEQSQQVFRNYIDKYKNNVHFLSACSNIQKVIESLQSRLHIIKITPPSDAKILSTANKIIQTEKIMIDMSSLEFILKKSGHSIRNVINNLEKISIYQGNQKLDIDTCDHLCSTISFHYFDKYIQHLKKGELSNAIDVFNDIYDYGYSVIDILNYFFIYIKNTNIIDEETKYRIIPILCKYITIFHNTHEHSIELALFTNNLFSLFT